MRKLIGSLLAAGAAAALAVAPAAAELDLCIVDPTVMVDGTPIQVGLYTYDQELAYGGVSRDVPIFVALVGSRDSRISTDVAAWQQHDRTTRVVVFDALPGRDRGHTETVEIEALVPSPLASDRFFIKVTLPDGLEHTASGPVNTLVRLRVQVPVDH